mgnify:CR=1 FL=1
MKNNIEYILRKKIETTMIGALARFEEGFGDIWGHDSDNPTQEQLRYQLIWDKIRNEILDHGNNQLRKGISELRGNRDDKIKYSYYYKFNNNKENNR